MDIIFTDYSEESISDRNISKEVIKDALLNPEEIVKAKKENRMIAHKMVGDKLLRVVFEANKKAYIVVTAYYTHPERYMKK